MRTAIELNTDGIRLTAVVDGYDGFPAARVWRVVRLCAARGIIEQALWYLVYHTNRPAGQDERRER